MLMPACDGGDESGPGSSKKPEDSIVETDKPSAAAQGQALKQQEANEKADAPVPRDKSEKPSEEQPVEPATKWSTRNEPGLTVSEQDVYEEAKVVCGLKPPRGVARDFGLSTSDPDVIATRYARGYAPALKQPAYEGCFEGLTR